MTKFIEVKEVQEGVIRLWLGRADKKNALSISVLEELLEILQEEGKTLRNRVLIISGKGDCFCTGLDLLEAADPKTAERGIELYTEVLKSIYLNSMITISTIHGYTIAGGAGIASVCDYVIAEKNTQLGFPEIHRGLVAAIVFAFLRRQLGERAIKELFLFGEYISAERAKEFGLLNEVVPEIEVEKVLELKVQQALMAAPAAVGHLKKLMEERFIEDLMFDIEHALAIHKVARSTKESLEGIKAFLEKKTPSWYPKSMD